MQNSIVENQEKGEITRVKSIRMIDLNGKKHCQVMVDVNFAPSKPIRQSEIDQTVFQITWDDGTQGEYRLIEIQRFTLANYWSCLTFPSHGMDFYDFYSWWKDRYPGVNSETEMAAYFYKKNI